MQYQIAMNELYNYFEVEENITPILTSEMLHVASEKIACRELDVEDQWRESINFLNINVISSQLQKT